LGPGKRVLGLIDCTVFGSASDCVLFTTDAVHYHNGIAKNCHPNPGSLEYTAFPRRSFEYQYVFCISVGVGQFFSLNGSQVPRADVLRMLNRIKEVMSGQPPTVELAPAPAEPPIRQAPARRRPQANLGKSAALSQRQATPLGQRWKE